MAIITPALLVALRTGFKKSYQDGLGMAKPQYTKIATVVKSTTASNTYGWLGQWPGFREWVGDRVIKDMEAHSYQIFNKDFESTVGVKRTDIEDDNLGIYSPMMQEMGRATSAFPDELVFPLLKSGFASLCYDGQNFFDADHPVNDQVDGQGTDESVSNVLIDAGYTGEAWYLLDTTRSIKPLIYQDRKAPKFTAMTKEDDESVFMRKEYRYGVDLRCNVGFGFWQMAFGAQAELTYENLWDVYTAMRSFKADGGRPLGIKPNMLVVPIALEKAALEIVDAEFIPDGAGSERYNPLFKKFEIVVPDFLA